MKNKLLFFLLALFVVYLISQDATQTGSTANDFFGWVESGLGQTREFVAALFGSDDTVVEAIPAVPTAIVP